MPTRSTSLLDIAAADWGIHLTGPGSSLCLLGASLAALGASGLACFVLHLFVRQGSGYQAGTRRSCAADFACRVVQPLQPFVTHEQTWLDCLSLPWTASASVAVAATETWLRRSTGATTYTAATVPDDCACAASPAGQTEESSDCPLLF